MGSLGDGVKKVLLAGIGTAAVTAEKSKEVLDKMAERGEAAVEQGKVLNQELRHLLKIPSVIYFSKANHNAIPYYYIIKF